MKSKEEIRQIRLAKFDNGYKTDINDSNDYINNISNINNNINTELIYNNNNPLLRCNISSDKELLTSLNLIYPFIPNENSIRPSVETLEYKRLKLMEIYNNYDKFEDYILNTIFNIPTIENEITNKKYVLESMKFDLFNEKVFIPNDFPYNISIGNHYVMWYATPNQPYSLDNITNDINLEIKKILSNSNSEKYDFSWYINPKMTVPEFFHVQVFWYEWN
jgi:hypothetical protein